MITDRLFSISRRLLLTVFGGLLAAALAVPASPASAAQLAVATDEGGTMSSTARTPEAPSSPPVTVAPLLTFPAETPRLTDNRATPGGPSMPPLSLAIVGMPLDMASSDQPPSVGLQWSARYRTAFTLETTTRPRKSFLAIGQKKGLRVRSKVGSTGDLLQNSPTSNEDPTSRGMIFLSFGW